MLVLSLILGVISYSAHTVTATNTPTASPTSFLDPWSIGETEYDIIEVSSFAYLEIQNTIGNGVDPGDVSVELYDHDCEVKKNSSGLVVELDTIEYISSPHIYEARINPELITTDTEGFVTINNEGGNTGSSVGSIAFCTKTSTFSGPIEVTYRLARWALRFNLTENAFEIENVVMEDTEIDEFIDTDVEFEFSIQACLCETNSFECITDPDISYVQNESPCFCLKPIINGSPELPAPVDIVNFDLNLIAGQDDDELIYTPVEFGSNGPIDNALTDIFTGGPNLKVKKICTVIISAFYSRGFQELSASGNCFLAFPQEEARSLPEFSAYELVFAIEPAAQESCLKSLFASIKTIFESSLGSITSSVTGVEETASDAVDNVLDFFDGFSASDIPDLASDAVDIAVDNGPDTVDFIGDAVGDVTGDIAGDALDVLGDAAEDAVDTIQETIDGAIEDVTDFSPFA